MKLGFIGLGTMGAGMAARLLAAGHELVVCNRTYERTRPLVDAGAAAVQSPGEIGDVDAVVTMLSDDAAEEQVAFEGGLIDRLPLRAIHIACSTIGVGTAHRLAEAHRKAGRPFVSAPVSGRGDMAAAGKLFVLASGPSQALARCRPVFDALGQRTFAFGEAPGTSNAAKLGLNLMLSACIQTMGEAFALAEGHGVAKSEFYDLFTATMFDAPVFRIYGDIIARRAFLPANTTVPIGLKDMRLIARAAEQAGLRLPFAEVVEAKLVEALARGMADHDWSVISETH